MIIDHVYEESHLTVHTCSGTISSKELHDAIKALHEKEPNPYHLWDLTDADLSLVTGKDVEELAAFIKQQAPPRLRGRSAIVTSTDFIFGLSRMFEAFTEISGLGIEVRVFRVRQEAEEWLKAAPDN